MKFLLIPALSDTQSPAPLTRSANSRSCSWKYRVGNKVELGCMYIIFIEIKIRSLHVHERTEDKRFLFSPVVGLLIRSNRSFNQVLLGFSVTYCQIHGRQPVYRLGRLQLAASPSLRTISTSGPCRGVRLLKRRTSFTGKGCERYDRERPRNLICDDTGLLGVEDLHSENIGRTFIGSPLRWSLEKP